MLKISQREKIDFPQEDRELLEDIYQYVLGEEGLPQVTELSLLITDNEEIKIYNRDYRGMDQATDVLSFPMYEAEELAHLKGADLPQTLLLGDIIISRERAEEQAREYGHSFSREIAYLFLHGILHLLGFDHLEEEEKEEMRAREEEILNKFSLAR